MMKIEMVREIRIAKGAPQTIEVFKSVEPSMIENTKMALKNNSTTASMNISLISNNNPMKANRAERVTGSPFQRL